MNVMAEDQELLGLLAEYALGTLEANDRAEVERLLARQPELRARLGELEASMGVVGAGLPAPKTPWAKVAAELEGAKRFAHLIPALARHFDFSEEKAWALAERFDRVDAWEAGPAEGVRLMPVEAGPKWSGFVTAVLSVQPGAQLPFHTHGAREEVLVLEGGYRDDQAGTEFWRGALDVREAGTAHSFTAIDGPACLCASVTTFTEDP